MWSAASILVCALSVLGRSERTFHPIKLVSAVPPGGSPNAEAFVTRDPPTIHLVTSSGIFQDAMRWPYECGDRPTLAKIASLLVHEEWHLRNGPDEQGAYYAQLTALNLLGYDEQSRVYGVVKRSMTRVLSATVPRTASLRGNPGPGEGLVYSSAR